MKLHNILGRRDMLRCVLCKEAPCDAACPLGLEPAGKLRSIWFGNEDVAALRLLEAMVCRDCLAPCEGACLRSGQVPVRKLLMRLTEGVRPLLDTDLPKDEQVLSSDICGIPLENPFLLSSSVVASNYEMCARAFEAGWAGAAFKTICTLDIHEASPRFSSLKGDSGTIIGFKNVEQLSDHSLKENMKTFRHLKAAYPKKVILASIMGKDEREWEELSRACQENGADVLELNFSCPNMMEGGLGSDVGQVPELVERYTAAARRGADIPILAKLTPNVAHMSPAAEAARRGGASGLAAINTIKSIMQINLHSYVSAPAVNGKSAVGGYSGAAVKPIALRFLAELGQNPKLKGMHLSGMGGIETWQDALEFILLGASSVQVTTAVMQYGYRIIDDLKDGLNYYLHDKGVKSLHDLVGQALDSVSDTTDVLERDSLIFPRFDREKCMGCGRCVISCADGGHQALRLSEKRLPLLDGSKCVGCHLCVLVCPNEAINGTGKRIRRKISAKT